MNILIVTPSYGGGVVVEYMTSVMSLLAYFRDQKIKSQLSLVSYAQVEKVRSYAATRLLLEDFTHLLFIDSDMGFKPETVLSMLALDEPITAVAYPKRTIDFDRAYSAYKKYETPTQGLSHSLEFVFDDLLKLSLKQSINDEGKAQLKAGKFVKCQTAGTGIMLIRKDVIVKMRAAYPELNVNKPVQPYASFGNLPSVFQCFEAVKNEDGVFISEDASFCKRWADMGGEVWVNLVDEITHVGQKAFTASFISRYQ